MAGTTERLREVRLTTRDYVYIIDDKSDQGWNVLLRVDMGNVVL